MTEMIEKLMGKMSNDYCIIFSTSAATYHQINYEFDVTSIGC